MSSRPGALGRCCKAESSQLSAISYQLSAISYQLSAISYQLSAISYQLSEIFDEDDFVAVLVVDQVVGYLFYEQNAEAAGTHAHLRAQVRVTERIFGRIVHGGMRHGGQFESGAGVSHLDQDHTRGADIGQLATCFRVRIAAVLEGIAYQFVESSGELIAQIFRQIDHLTSEEINDWLPGFQFRRYTEADPTRQRGFDFNFRNALESFFGAQHFSTLWHPKNYLLTCGRSAPLALCGLVGFQLAVDFVGGDPEDVF
jgi:hypothetical protein